MSVDPWASEIHPPASYSPWWWVAALVCVVGIVAVLWWARRELRRIDTDAGSGLLDELRADTVARMERVRVEHRAGDLTSAAAATRISAELRRFVGIVTNGDTDYRVLPELRREAIKDPRLVPVVTLVADAEQVAFVPGPTDDEIEPLAQRAEEVVRQWT